VLETSVMLTIKIQLALILYYDFILHSKNALLLTLFFSQEWVVVNCFEEKRMNGN
jgi:hypothetical protein